MSMFPGESCSEIKSMQCLTLTCVRTEMTAKENEQTSDASALREKESSWINDTDNNKKMCRVKLSFVD